MSQPESILAPNGQPVPQDRPLRIVFMGTPDFAVPTLQVLIDGPHDVVAVYSQPDRPRGRGRKVTPSPVKQRALDAGIPVFQPQKMTHPDSLARFKADAPDLAVVVAYGKILRPRVLAVPPLGCINCHASLLPAYRGAAPIFWALAHGETESGITTMMMDAGMDTGDMLLRESLPIAQNETVGSLHDRLAAQSARLLGETLEKLVQGTLCATTQNHDAATIAPMLSKHDSWIDFSRTAHEVHNWIRAQDPFPGARARLPEKGSIKLFDSQGPCEGTGMPGEVLSVTPEGLCIACGEGAIRVGSLQASGKKRMTLQQYLAGNHLPEALVFAPPPPKESA